MERTRGMMLTAVVAAASLLALSGCAGGATGGGSATPTATVTSTVTATPAPATASPDDPLDALSAWTACLVLAQEVYANSVPNAKHKPYDPAHPPTQNADGTWQVTIGYPIDPPVQGAGSVVVSCQLSGTRGDPKLVDWATKDI